MVAYSSKRPRFDGGFQLLLSVIIPTRNRSNRLADLLDSLARQNPVNFEWEVLVVDNASTDGTSDLVNQKCNQWPIKIRYVIEPRLGLHYGRHRGAHEANGAFLGYLDDDMVLCPNWIQGVEALAHGSVDAVVGRILPNWESTPPQWLLMLGRNGVNGYLGLLDLGNHSKIVDPMLVFGGNCFIAKDLLFKLRGFNPDGLPENLLRYRGDGETALMRKFKKAGLVSRYDPIATAYHMIPSARMKLAYLKKRTFNQGISDSFSAIRLVHQLADSPHLGAEGENLPRITLDETIKRISSYLIRFKNGIFSPVSWIELYLKYSKKRDFRYHQRVVQEDPNLLNWVLKQDFLDQPF